MQPDGSDQLATSDPDGVALVPEPLVGRVFAAERRCRVGDSAPSGRIRLDALARYLQDVAYDDYAAAGFADEPDATWVARRVTMAIDVLPRFEEVLVLRTFASAIAPRWAERRISIAGEHGGRLEAAVLWVFLRPSTGAIAKLPQAFLDVYGEAAAGRTVRARFVHDATVPDDVEVLPWSLRVTDLDVLQHVNNAAYWTVIEELLAGVEVVAPMRAEVEHRRAIDAAGVLRLAHRGDLASGIEAWLLDGDEVAATFRLRSTAPGT